LVIDQIVGASVEQAASSGGRSSGSSAASMAKEGGKARRGGRFYNIYSTYVYGDDDDKTLSTLFLQREYRR